MIEVDTGHYFTPCSVKAILIVNNAVLLCLNGRDEWELPGGWPAPMDPTIQDTVKREVF
jgi:8-oxo-dGTP pyrophosphatase MutT (NUDIX family)